jgi:uncharacterized protein YndB with AHSA1/START domain
MTAQSTGFLLHVERVLPAPPPLAFAAATEPATLAEWWGPKGFTAPSIELDLRVGGRYRIAMKPPDAAAFHLSGRFREIDPPRLLSYTFSWDEPDPDDQETLVTLSFGEDDDGTRLTVDQGRFATEARRELHVQGWTEALDRLHGLLSSRGR